MIQVEEVGVRFGATTALESVSFHAGPGESVAVLGPSGSGKTTLLRVIAGLIPVDKGAVHLDGRPVSTPDFTLPPFERGVGYAFQTPALWPHMTVAGNILFGLASWRRDAARDRLEELLRRMEVSDLIGRYPHQLSGGEARRVSVARALAPRPDYLLMDEPLTNLDPALRGKLVGIIEEQVEATGASMIYVTHVVEEAEAVADRILHLSRGRLVPEGGRS